MSHVIHPSAAVGALTIGAQMSVDPLDGLLGPVGTIVSAASFAAVGAYLLALLVLSVLIVVRRLGGAFDSLRSRASSYVPALEGHT